MRPCYDVMAYVQKVTLLGPGCGLGRRGNHALARYGAIGPSVSVTLKRLYYTAVSSFFQDKVFKTNLVILNKT